MTLMEQARAAVKATRDFEPAGERCTGAEVAILNRLCRDAYLACQAAGVAIAAMRVALYRQEREEHRAKLEAIRTDFIAAALAKRGSAR